MERNCLFVDDVLGNLLQKDAAQPQANVVRDLEQSFSQLEITGSLEEVQFDSIEAEVHTSLRSLLFCEKIVQLIFNSRSHTNNPIPSVLSSPFVYKYITLVQKKKALSPCTSIYNDRTVFPCTDDKSIHVGVWGQLCFSQLYSHT